MHNNLMKTASTRQSDSSASKESWNFKEIINPSPDSTPRIIGKSSMAEWENTPSPLRGADTLNINHKNLNTHEYEKDESPVLEGSFCNPEPPVELIEQHLVDADNIGYTVFSKHWLLTTLMKLIKYVDENSLKDVINKVDIDDEFQDELCKLWDMSMNQEVVKYLIECKALDLLQGVITKSNAPRITEICIGILANMACLPLICEQICSDQDFITILLELFQDHDPPTLIELFRLFNVCLQNKSSKSLVAVIKEKTVVYINVIFILQSSTNDVLLKRTAEFMSGLMEIDDEVCEKWSSDELVLALMEAIKQIGSHEGILLEPFLHVLQILSTFESGLQALETYCGEVITLAVSYLKHVSSEEIVVIDSKENMLCYSLSIIKALFIGWDGCVSSLVDDHQFLKSLIVINASFMPKFSRHVSLNEDDNTNESDSNVNNNYTNKSDSKSNINHTYESDSNINSNYLNKCDSNINSNYSNESDSNINSNSINESDSNIKSNYTNESDSSNNRNSSEIYDDKADANFVQKYEDQMLSIIYDLFKNIFCDIVDILHKIKQVDIGNDEADTTSCPESLKYLDSCHRYKLKYLFRILSSSPLQNYRSNSLPSLDSKEDIFNNPNSDLGSKSNCETDLNAKIKDNVADSIAVVSIQREHITDSSPQSVTHEHTYLNLLLDNATNYSLKRLCKLISETQNKGAI